MSAAAWQAVLDRLDDAAKLADRPARRPQHPASPRAPARGVCAGAHGRRVRRGVHRMACPPRHHPWARQGRHPLPPRRRRRRGEGTRRGDDLQDGHPRSALRRRQGRCALRSRTSLSLPELERLDAPLHLRDQPAARSRPRRAGARREHRRPRDGLADGHAVHDIGHAPSRRRSPASPCRSAAPGRTAAPPQPACSPAPAPPSRSWTCPSPGAAPCCRAAARSVARSPTSSRRRGCVSSPLPTPAARSPTRAGSTPSPWPTTWPPPARSPASAAARPSRPSRSGTSSASCSCPPRSVAVIDEAVARRLGATVVVEAANGPTTLDGAGGPRRARRGGGSRHPGQRRRRHRLLLRVGAVAAGLPLGRADLGRAAAQPYGGRLRDRVGTGQSLGVDLRRAAHVVALERVAEAIEARGLFP